MNRQVCILKSSAVPLRLNKKVKNSANSETESEDDRRSISAYHIP